MKLLKNKVIIITGATRGIGKRIIEKFAEYGATIIFTYLTSHAKAEELENNLSIITTIKGFKSDASNYHSTQELVKQVINEFGKIDVLINNAGITCDNLLIRMSKEEWDSVIKVNLGSVFNFTKAVIKPMVKQRFGSIINISSIVGIKGNLGQANYAASKAGIIGFSKSIALELGSRNIRCNTIAPGFIITEMTNSLSQEIIKKWIEKIPLKRAGTVDDVANACLFLSTELSSYITGQVININGGMF